jgi:hypothetical protein
MKNKTAAKMAEIRKLASACWNPRFCGLGEWWDNEDDNCEPCAPYETDKSGRALADWEYDERILFTAENIEEGVAIIIWDGFDDAGNPVSFASEILNKREIERVKICSWDYIEDDQAWEMFVSVRS